MNTLDSVSNWSKLVDISFRCYFVIEKLLCCYIVRSHFGNNNCVFEI